MTWDDHYRQSGHLWGYEPSILAVAPVNSLKPVSAVPSSPSMHAIGCGYGRDAFYIAETVACRIPGIDVSEKSIEMGSVRAEETGNHFLPVHSLEEHDYHEPRVTGEVHHHVSWVLIGTRE